MSARQGLFRDQLRSPGRLSRQQIAVAALALVALLLTAAILRDVFFPPAGESAGMRTATVQRGTVRSAVSGTGTVVPASQQNLNFRVAGQLTEVDVKVGDHVTPGRVLAKIDARTYQTALDQANASLQQAQSNLNNTLNGNAVQQAQHSLASAQTSYHDTAASVGFTNQQDASAVAADQQQLQGDQNQLSADQARLAADQTAHAARVQQDQANVAADQFAYNACLSANHGDPAPCQYLFVQLQQDQYKLQQDQAPLTASQGAVNADNQKVAADQAKLGADQTKQASDQLNGQKQLDQAQSAITQAQDQLNSQTIQRPNTIASQEAAVASAQAQVQNAQANLDATTLTSPADATVMSLTGAVGESVSTGGGLTTQAPGGTAPQPAGAGSGSSSASTQGAGAGASSASASGGGGSTFLVLGNISGLQVVAPFAEADAARVQGNQQATVTFDAVPNLSVPAHVLAVAVTSTVVSNVTNYLVTLTLDQADERLKSGMTANTSVVVSEASNVLVLPNSAVTRIGGQSFVTLLGRDGKTETRVQVETGAVGDTSTEITSGLNLGDRVVLPQLRTQQQQPGGTRAPGGGGPGGGGGVRIG